MDTETLSKVNSLTGDISELKKIVENFNKDRSEILKSNGVCDKDDLLEILENFAASEEVCQAVDAVGRRLLLELDTLKKALEDL